MLSKAPGDIHIDADTIVLFCALGMVGISKKYSESRETSISASVCISRGTFGNNICACDEVGQTLLFYGFVSTYLQSTVRGFWRPNTCLSIKQ